MSRTVSAPDIQNEFLVDTHCHLQMEQFNGDLEEVIERARNSGVRSLILIGTDSRDNPEALALAEKKEFIHVAAGIHPHDASSLDDRLLSELRRWLSHPKVVAVGETGLDYHYMHSPREVQRKAFMQHIELAKQMNLPLVVHSREANDETMEILRMQSRDIGPGEKLRGVIHCFSGDRAMAERAVEMGFYISITGPVTYKKSEALRQVVKSIPIENMLLETDAPYLSPVPLRGKRNEPAYMVHTAQKIAELKGLSLNDVARITSLNAHILFGIGEPAEKGRIAYRIRNSLYLNITNRCTSRCSFCAKDTDAFVKGHNLKLKKEPSADEIIQAIGEPENCNEVVFCGYGEPLLRLDTVKYVASWIKSKGLKVRVNTNGHANLIHKKNILSELKGLVDVYSISLNAQNRDIYNRICQPGIDRAWDGTVDFIRKAVQTGGAEVVATVVDMPGVDTKECEKIAYSLGAKFRVRTFNVVG